MKNLIIVLALTFSMIAAAGEPSCSEESSDAVVTGQLEIKTDVPKWLKGATIIIRTADGRESRVPAEKFKVVPRKQQFITTATQSHTTRTCSTNTPRKNRVSAVLGYGPKGGLDTNLTNSPGFVEVESRRGVNVGAQYQRMLDERWSLGVQLKTNHDTSVLGGFDF